MKRISTRVLVASVITSLMLLGFQNCGGGFSSSDGANFSSQGNPGGNPSPTPSPGPIAAQPAPAPGPKDLSAATWRPISTVNAPTDNNCPSAVWTGTRMLVVGGVHGPNGNFSVNPAGNSQVWSYNPKDDTWEHLVTASRPPGRISHTSVWDGTRLVNFGGLMNVAGCISPGCYFYEVYNFNPATLTWTQGTNAPIVNGLYVARYGHASVWTGTRMLTYAGDFPNMVFNVAAAYDPVGNAWSVPPAGPDARSYVSGTMFGTKAYFWGGANEVDYMSATATGFPDGVIFDNVTQTWSRGMAASPLAMRAAAAMSSSATQVIVWGGRLGANSYNDGAVFEPANNTWKALPLLNAPAPRACAASVWTGEEFIVWGGLVNGAPSATGGILK